MAISPPTGSRTRMVVLVLASVTLIVVGLRDVPIVRDLREGASAVVSPIENAIGTVTSPVRNAWHGVTDYEDLQRENDQLQVRSSPRRSRPPSSSPTPSASWPTCPPR